MGLLGEQVESLRVTYETEVFVSGGGPVGMLMAYQLARSGISCIMIEQGTRTTAHPKMEFLSPRSMEIFRALGLGNRLRSIGVPEHYECDEIFTTGLSRKDGNLKTIVCSTWGSPL
jgi:flavin-dependent dehydrogenase